MSNLTITKENYLKYLRTWNAAAETFVESLKKLCKISPEFTHEPRMKIFNDGILYESYYSYGKFVAQLKFEFFCLDRKKLRDHDTLVFDLRSFDIKVASSRQIGNSCGSPPKWYDPKRELNDKIIELIDRYIQIRVELKGMK